MKCAGHNRQASWQIVDELARLGCEKGRIDKDVYDTIFFASW